MWPLIGAISGLSFLGWFVNTFTPDSFPRLVLFFLIVAATTFYASLFFVKIVRRAAFVTIGVVIILILRLLGLREVWYVLLLIPCLISLEILLRVR